jgi:dihydroneopterin aldolase
MERKKEKKEALRKFKEKDNDESRIKYWENKNAYEKSVENKRCMLQEKEAEYINKLIRKKLKISGNQ